MDHSLLFFDIFFLTLFFFFLFFFLVISFITGERCEGGASFTIAAISVAAACSVFYFILLIVLACCSKPPGNKKERAARRKKKKITLATFNQAKLMLTFLQVLSSMNKTCSDVPWPKNFMSFTAHIEIVNLDLMGLFVGTQCTFSVSPLDRFLLHMAVPILLATAFVGAYFTTSCLCSGHCHLCGKKSMSEKMKKRFDKDGDGHVSDEEVRHGMRQIRWMTTVKSLILVILMIYPGLGKHEQVYCLFFLYFFRFKQYH